MKISILTVSLNPGSSLLATVTSILSQQNADFEIIIKDGGSTDGSLRNIPADDRIRLICEPDAGIYDAMNQAVKYADGEFALYLNCGDLFYSSHVLEGIISAIQSASFQDRDKTVFYGDCFIANRNYILHYPQQLSCYTCFTTVLCHQATVYPIALLQSRPFSSGYKIAADFEYYVYAYKNGYRLQHIPLVIAHYEGNGISETAANRKLALDERKRALLTHLSKEEYNRNWWKAQLHGVGIKQWLVRFNWFYPVYSKLASVYYNLFAKK
jgi:glycosyltransferase involved in cell wall biosynthesis